MNALGNTDGVVTLETAVAQIMASLPPPQTDRIPLQDSAGRILAESILSALDLPAFDNSAMDGYAVRAADVRGANAEAPARLRLRTRIPAGEVFSGELAAGECARLFTGAPVPCGADAVVMQEDTRTEGDHIQVFDEVQPGENIRFQGEDVRRGTTLIQAGEELSAGKISLLAATGVGDVQVARQPIIGLVATGSELREAGATLLPGQIYESNRAMLSPLVTRAGAVPRIYPLVPDNLEATRAALEVAFRECDVVITSGGVSVGEMDFVKAAFEALGGTLEFWKVAIRPGKPFVWGRLGEKHLFGLPGNPVSAFVTFLLLVRPALRRWLGAPDVSLPACPGVLGEPIANSGERRHFLRVRMDVEGNVFSAGKQASHALASLAAANGLLDVPPNVAWPAGTTVRILRGF